MNTLDWIHGSAIDHLHNYGPGTRFRASLARIGCDMRISNLSFRFSSALEWRSATTVVFSRCSNLGRASSSLFSHSFPQSGELRKRWLLAICQADWSNFRVPNSTVVCIEHVLPEKNFRFHARAWEPVALPSPVLLKGRLDTSRKQVQCDRCLLFACMFPKWEYKACRRIERKRDLFPTVVFWPNDMRPLTIGSWQKARGRVCNASEFCARRLFSGKEHRGELSEVTMYEHLWVKKLGFLALQLWPIFLHKFSLRRAMLQIEFRWSKPDESNSEQSKTESRKTAFSSSETLKSNAGDGPAAAGCPVPNPDNNCANGLLWPLIFEYFKHLSNHAKALSIRDATVRKKEMKRKKLIIELAGVINVA